MEVCTSLSKCKPGVTVNLLMPLVIVSGTLSTPVHITGLLIFFFLSSCAYYTVSVIQFDSTVAFEKQSMFDVSFVIIWHVDVVGAGNHLNQSIPFLINITYYM